MIVAHPHPAPARSRRPAATGLSRPLPAEAGYSPLTRDTLLRVGRAQNDRCPACGDQDSVRHVLTECPVYGGQHRPSLTTFVGLGAPTLRSTHRRGRPLGGGGLRGLRRRGGDHGDRHEVLPESCGYIELSGWTEHNNRIPSGTAAASSGSDRRRCYERTRGNNNVVATREPSGGSGGQQQVAGSGAGGCRQWLWQLRCATSVAPAAAAPMGVPGAGCGSSSGSREWCLRRRPRLAARNDGSDWSRGRCLRRRAAAAAVYPTDGGGIVSGGQGCHRLTFFGLTRVSLMF